MLTPGKELERRLAGIKLVLMDIDGTLVSPGHPTFDNVVNQLRRLRPLGIDFSIATGRSIRGASFVTGQLRRLGAKLPPMITYNGAVVFSGRDSSLFRAHKIPRESFEALIKYARSVGLSVTAYACEPDFEQLPVEQVFREGKRSAATLEFNGMSVEYVDSLLALDRQFVAALLDVPDADSPLELTAKLHERFGGEVRVTTSGGRLIEVCNLLGTKQHAMAEMARLLNIGVVEILAIGDNYNDIEMLSAAGVGAAVANAPDGVKAHADMVSTMSSGMGVVEVLRTLTRAVRYFRQGGVN